MIKYAKGQIWYYKDPNVKVTTHSTAQGSVQSGTRPVIVVSNDVGNKHSSICMIVPLTTKIKNNLPTHFNFYINNIYNTALCEQIITVPQDSLVSYVGTLELEEHKKLNECLICALNVNSALNFNVMNNIDKVNTQQIKPVKTQISKRTRIVRSPEEKIAIMLAYEDAKKGNRTMQSIVDEYNFSCYSSLTSSVHVWKKEAKK